MRKVLSPFLGLAGVVGFIAGQCVFYSGDHDWGLLFMVVGTWAFCNARIDSQQEKSTE